MSHRLKNLKENKLLEKLEDEFVSNTTAAVETMEEITDSSEILGLIKLFQNFQLVYFRQCVQEVEANLKSSKWFGNLANQATKTLLIHV